MIENELRAAFARHEDAVVDVARLRVAIDQEAGRRRSRRTVLRTSGAVLAVALAAMLPAVGLDLSGAGHRQDGPGPAAAPTAGRALNLLLLGIDRRPGQGADIVARADTIMIVHIPASRDRGFLLSVPRDTRVAIPAYPRTGTEPTVGWINSAFALGSSSGGGVSGGVELTALALRQATGLTFDGAGVVDMAGFRRVIDAVGGVSFCVDQEVRSVHTGRVFQPGCRRLSGEEAMDYLRQRLDLPNGARDRDRHNQQFLRALVDEMLRLDVLTNPAKVSEILRAAGSALTVDLQGRSLDDLVLELRAISAADITGVKLPVRDLPVIAGQTPAAEFVEPLAGELFDAMRRDGLAEFLARHPELKWLG